MQNNFNFGCIHKKNICSLVCKDVFSSLDTAFGNNGRCVYCAKTLIILKSIKLILWLDI